MNISRHVVSTFAVAAVSVLAASQAGAQVRYAPRPEPEAIYPFGVPYDESYGGGYSFEIQPYALPGPAVRVVRRCAYPDGWNVTDFSRDVNGIPSGLDHVCPGDGFVGARTRYRQVGE